MSIPVVTAELAEMARARRAPLGGSRRLGPQGRLVVAFVSLLSAAIGVTCWAMVWQMRERTEQLMGENAAQLCELLAVGSAEAMSQGRWELLDERAGELTRGRQVAFVAFTDTEGDLRVLRSRDPDHAGSFPRGIPEAHRLMTLERSSSPALGDYLSITAPAFYEYVGFGPLPAGSAGTTRLAGYVTVGLSLSAEQAHIQRLAVWIAGAAGVILVVSVPLVYAMVHRIFAPIRELVAATKSIIAGNLDTLVALDRRDLIGDLARSFNDMAQWVRKQQTDLNAANNQLAEANRRLETRIEQRTSQLETANKRLSEEIAEKEDFLRAVSHDLNAPLRNIDGMVSMLLLKRRDQLDEDVINRLERIKKNVEVESDLISELLELSRIKTRRQKMEPVDLESIIIELRGLFENDLRTRGIDVLIETTLPTLNCERARIRQVFQNLIDNAIKYMGEGPDRRISVGCVRRVTEVEFYVRDTGIGIDPEDLDKVFFIFRRGKNTHGSNVSGKGVGLASVKSIIETYNGRIWVESTKGVGTTFHFTINGQYLPENEFERLVSPASSPKASRGLFARPAPAMSSGSD